ncbi:hypothetical protein K438DRAFT_1858078 [Mycena galopus ATCC 62051]|nr:hypothetical protein K438DRAFT_1858078 [Mycena galopus ATCC 62051]
MNSPDSAPAGRGLRLYLAGGTGGQGGYGGMRGGHGGPGGKAMFDAEPLVALGFVHIRADGGVSSGGGKAGVLGHGGDGGKGEGAAQVTTLLGRKVEIALSYLPLEEFAREYHLGRKTIDALAKLGFESAGGILKVSEADLKDGGFQVGQIAELKRALEEWVQAVAKK